MAYTEQYFKIFNKEFECLKRQLVEDGYDLDKEIDEETSEVYDKEYEITETHWNSFPNEEFSIAVNGYTRNELNKTTCENLEVKKSKMEYLGFYIGAYDAVIEFYYDDKEDTLYTFLYHYDTYRPNDKRYKRHKRHLSVVFESKLKGKDDYE